MTDQQGPENPDERSEELWLDAIQADLRAALSGTDEPAPQVLAGARAAWEWRTIDAELAELLEEEQLAMRSVLNTVTLSAGDIFIDVDRHDAAAGTTHLVGQVTAPTPLRRVMVETTARGGARIPAEIDVLGGFRADVPSEGALRVVVELTDGRTIVGTWLPA